MGLMALAHEAYSGGCIFCGEKPVEMHEWQKRQKTKRLGTLNHGLITGLLPLCKKCHSLDPTGEHAIAIVKKIDSDVLKRLCIAAMEQSWMYENRQLWR